MRTFLAATAVLALTSCATMVNGRAQQVKVDSFPGHAAIRVDCGDASHDGGFTPATLALPRGAETCQLTLHKDGYADRPVVFERQMSRAVRGNAVAGAPVAVVAALIGLIIDEEIGTNGDVAAAGWGIGMSAGSAPGRQVDERTGGAYKWVPGEVFIVLLKPQQ